MRMNEAVNMQGEKMIVLSETEYLALIEDAGDIAVAQQAKAASSGA